MKTLSNDTLNHVAKFLKAMGEETRLKILRALHDEELTVTEIIAKVAGTQSNVSKHLAVLTAAGILAFRKEGTSTYYKIADSNIMAICDSVCRSIGDRIRHSKSTLKNIERGFLKNARSID